MPAGDGKAGSRVCELTLAQASPGVHRWTTLFDLKWNRGLWLKPESGLGVTDTDGQKQADQILEALLLRSLMLSSGLSAALEWSLSLKKTYPYSKNQPNQGPFSKPFEISQLKAEWEPDIPNGPLFPTASHLRRKFKNPFSEKLTQQQFTSSFVMTKLKWGELSPEFFISLNINITGE